MIRIVYIRQHMGPVNEGTSTRGWEHVRRLAADGHAVTLVSGSHIPSADLPEGVRLRALPTQYRQSMGFVRRKISFIAFAVKAVLIALSGRYHVVFASSTPLTVFVPGLVAKCIRPSTRLVLEVRDLWPAIPIVLGALQNPLERWLAVRLERLSYRMADKLIALSPGMAAYIKLTSGRDAVVVPNGASRSNMVVGSEESVDLTRELGLSDKDRVVLYAGSIGAIHDPDYLRSLILSSIENEPTIHFVIVGSGLGHDDLRSQFRGHPRVHIVGRVSRAEIPRFFVLADISLVTVIDEPLMATNSANKFADSLAAACPVAVNYGGWHAQMLDEYGAGIRLSCDPAEAAALLATVLADSASLQRMVEGARKLGEQFEWDNLYPTWKRALLDD